MEDASDRHLHAVFLLLPGLKAPQGPEWTLCHRAGIGSVDDAQQLITQRAVLCLSYTYVSQCMILMYLNWVVEIRANDSQLYRESPRALWRSNCCHRHRRSWPLQCSPASLPICGGRTIVPVSPAHRADDLGGKCNGHSSLPSTDIAGKDGIWTGNRLAVSTIHRSPDLLWLIVPVAA